MRIDIIGAGYVGLVTGACLARAGHSVICADVDAERIAAIQRGTAPFHEPGLDRVIARGIADGALSATTDVAAAVESSELTIVAVGTPLRNGAMDSSFLEQACMQVGAALRGWPGYHTVAVKSTVIPGTTDTLVRNTLERASGRRAGEFGLCMNPEFLREGSAVEDCLNPDRIVIGEWDGRSGEVLGRLYAGFSCPKIFTSLRNAELIKYASNALLATLVSFSNELAGLCESTPDADVSTVLSALHLDRRLSVAQDGRRLTAGIAEYLRAGCGFGGSCLPKDVAALSAYGRRVGRPLRLLDAVLELNAERPARLVRLAEQAVGSLREELVTVLGLAFKPGTDDLRDSPALAIIQILLASGARVRAYDPVANARMRAALDARVELCGAPEDALRGSSAAILATAWPEFREWDWKPLLACMRLPVLIDGRNVLEGVPLPGGMTYLRVGRQAPVPAIEPELASLAGASQ